MLPLLEKLPEKENVLEEINTKELVRLIQETRFEKFPEQVIMQGKRCFLDWLGGALAASNDVVTQKALAIARLTGGYPQAMIIGNQLRAPVLMATLVNGIMGHVLECDDSNPETFMHPSDPILPAVLSLVEWQGMSGKDFLTAFIVGYEVQARIGLAVKPSHYQKGWHATGTLGTFGAASATAKLLQLNEEEIINSLGIAATQAAGLRKVYGSMSRSFNAGKAAMNGLLATLLAQQGFTCGDNVIEGEKGFLRLYSSDEKKNLVYVREVDYHILYNVFKIYPCGLFVHPVVDAILKLRKNYRLSPEEIKEVILFVSKLTFDVTAIKKPRTGLEGKLSLDYCAALAIAEGKVSIEGFTDEKINDPGLASLQEKIKIVPDPNLNEMQARVLIYTRAGIEIRQDVDYPWGNLENTISDNDLHHKFYELTEPLLGKTDTLKLINYISNLEQLENLKPVINLCH